LRSTEGVARGGIEEATSTGCTSMTEVKAVATDAESVAVAG
jgi:hypothetical protein